MARDLGDVLHYFIPETGETSPSEAGAALPADFPAAVRSRPGAHGERNRRERRIGSDDLTVIAVPLGPRDLLRATFVWNLAVEMTSQGASTTVVAPSRNHPPVWPEPGRDSVGAEFVPTLADGLGDLSRAALDVAVSRAADEPDPSVVIVCIPPEWLRKAADGAPILKRVMLFTSPDTAEIMEAYALAKHLWAAAPKANVGVTIYGVRSVDVAARTFERMAETARHHVGCQLTSYGLLVDELQIYRAIVERRPIALFQPQSRAARSLRDVARLLLDDTTALSDE